MLRPRTRISSAPVAFPYFPRWTLSDLSHPTPSSPLDTFLRCTTSYPSRRPAYTCRTVVLARKAGSLLLIIQHCLRCEICTGRPNAKPTSQYQQSTFCFSAIPENQGALSSSYNVVCGARSALSAPMQTQHHGNIKNRHYVSVPFLTCQASSMGSDYLPTRLRLPNSAFSRRGRRRARLVELSTILLSNISIFFVNRHR